MARVFTVYNCGTGFNRERKDELIGNLGTITAGMEARPGNLSPHDAWMINDGPGSKPSAPGSQARTPGSGPFKQLRGNLTGHGWEQNVQQTMDAIKFLTRQTPINIVNMAGWSRGAVTCHMLANALKQDAATSNISVNIFAVDPVAGPGNRTAPDKNSLPDNVANYLCVLSEDENRKIMKPVNVYQLRTSAQDIGTKFRIIHIPGEHNTGVLKGTPAGKLVWALAHRFLVRHGTVLNQPLQLSPLEICELYAGMRYYLGAFRNMHGTAGKQLGTASRDIKNEFLAHHYWVNDHHMRNFMRAFPEVARLIENPNLLANRGSFDAALARIGTSAPWTYTSMKKVGLVG